MTTATNIVLADAQATPVNHTFNPIGIDPKTGTFWFVDSSQANAVGYWRISVEFKTPPQVQQKTNSDGRVYRARIGLHEPALETVSNNTVSGIAPAPTVSYMPRVFTEYIMPERSSLQNRKDLRKMNYNLQNDANVIAVVENLNYLS